MNVQFGEGFLKFLFYDRMMGIPVFLILMILVVLFPFLSRRIYWLSSSYRLPDVRPPNIMEKGWLFFLRGSLLFVKTAIIIGFAGWILFGIVLLFGAGLIMFHDLIKVFSSNLTFTFRIFSSNFVPVIIGMLLIISGGWLAKFLLINLAGEGTDDAFRLRYRLYWYSIIAVLSVILLLLNIYIMGILFGFIAFFPLKKSISEYIQVLLAKKKTENEKQKVFSDITNG
jgi:hypothetical protein